MSITDSSIGTELAGYRIEALLGRGGMGVVYLADDLRLKRKVALKLLAGELSGNEHFRERFLSESELAASIDHPNILPIYGAGEIAGQLYIAMRYVDGTDLKQLLRREGALDPEGALAIVGQIAAALDAAHALGLVHRDVKPSNVLLNLEGHAYLADFGLSRRTTGETEGTGLVGTIDYVAPEQIRGEPVDGRADLYALGCLLCECLTGEPPFKRDSEAALIFAHLEEEPPSPPGLEIVVAKALAKAPEERYSSGAELVAAAREALGMDGPAPWWRTPVIVSVIGAALALAAVLAFLLLRGGSGVPTAVKGSLVRIDPATNRVSASIPVGKDRAESRSASTASGSPTSTTARSWRSIRPRTRSARRTRDTGARPGSPSPATSSSSQVGSSTALSRRSTPAQEFSIGSFGSGVIPTRLRWRQPEQEPSGWRTAPIDRSSGSTS